MYFAQLNTQSNFSFLAAASHPHEYIEQALELGYGALALCDECSLAGIVKAFKATQQAPEAFKLLVGSRFRLSNGLLLLVLAPNRQAYAELSGFITLARWRAAKGEYQAHMDDLRFRLRQCLVIWLAEVEHKPCYKSAKILNEAFKQRLWLGISRQFKGGEESGLAAWQAMAQQFCLPIAACPLAQMHVRSRKPLFDVLRAIDENCSVADLGTRLPANAENHLKSIEELKQLYSEEWLQQAWVIAEACSFSMSELQYQYPQELVPKHLSPGEYLRQLVQRGEQWRYPQGTPDSVQALLQKELGLIAEMRYEYYFLTVYDIVQFAKKQKILCQGRGSAANSVVCYCLGITEIAPSQINVLFERFISKERDEPPDIDVDFEHQRREEVIQYIYNKYGRERAALAATVICYRARSAIRDVGKAMGLAPSLIEHFAKSLAWWDRSRDLKQRIQAAGLAQQQQCLLQFFALVQQILGFPRHLSQHVGGFVIAQDKVSDLVPQENASMPERTVIQWDKEDLETMKLLKVDVLALGMLTALRKALHYVSQYDTAIKGLEDIPREDAATYDMLCQGDSVGVFQVESRAQMSMLPRLRPRTFYDLVIEIAIVRPGPIQGDMVHPYLRRRSGLEEPSYINDEIKEVLHRTLGVPIFQEQAIRLSMVAAGFSGGEADELRRAMASWGKDGRLLQFEQRFIEGMQSKGYSLEFAQRLFGQIKGFGGYGFPESHSASFALLCYASSWIKAHHPAAFYCALLNSQPMGFYSPSQLIQDALRHDIRILPVDVNASTYENRLERVEQGLSDKQNWAVRLGFCRVKSLDEKKAQAIESVRGEQAFSSVRDFVLRSQFSGSDIQCLASADALRSISGHRYQARWQAAALQQYNPMLSPHENTHDALTSAPPSLEQNIIEDYSAVGGSLRVHPMAILRRESPFNRCTCYRDLFQVRHGRFVQVAGLVTGRQRPGTAKGTIFLTLEDETGNINVIVWKDVQERFRKALLTAKLLLVKGTLEQSRDERSEQKKAEPGPAFSPVVHVVAGALLDYSGRLEQSFNLKSRDFH